MYRDWVIDMGKKRLTKRSWIQLISAIIYNLNAKGFVNGTIYQGKTKGICVPGLNCYSCPGAIGACPLGSLQSAIANPNGKLPFYVVGTIMLFGALFGRMICSFLCPFGFIQELLYKIPGPKLKKNAVTRHLTVGKYVVLVVFVIAMPYILYLTTGLGSPAFCKYICPAGTLEAGIPLVLMNEDLQSIIGFIFNWKMTLLAIFLLSAIFVYRAFCRFICPLGALYSFFNRIALFGVRVDDDICIHCDACVRFCKMDVKEVNDRECIRCGECIAVCPVNAISFYRRNKHENKQSKKNK